MQRIDSVYAGSGRRSVAPSRLRVAHARRWRPAIALLLAGLVWVGCKTSEDSVIGRVRAQQLAGEYAETIGSLRELIREGTIRGEVMVLYARALAFTGHPGRSSWALDTAMEDPDWIVPAGLQLARNAYESGNYELCLRTLDRIESERPDAGELDRVAARLRAQALIGTRRHYEEALEIVEGLLDDGPDDEVALRLQGIALLGLGRIEEAESLITQAGDRSAIDEVGLRPAEGEPFWCSVRARFQRESRDVEAALVTLRSCLEADPGAPLLVREAVELYAALGQTARVLEILEAAYAADPSNRDARLALVAQLVASGLPERAEAALREATKSSEPLRAVEAWIDLAVHLVNQERVPEALEAYDHAFGGMDAEPSPELQFAHAEALIFAGRHDEALRIADTTPVEIHRPMIRGRVAFERGQHESALMAFEEAALAWPNNAPIRYYLGRSAESIGDFDRAVEEYRHALRSDPALAEARTRLVEMHIAERRVRHALAVLRFSSPRQDASPVTPKERLLEVELRVLLGQAPDLARLPNDPDRTAQEMEAAAIEAFVRGLRRRGGAQAVLVGLGTLDRTRLGAPAWDVARASRVEALLALGRDDDALAEAHRAVEERPGVDRVQISLADALAQGPAGTPKAKSIYTAVLERTPGHPDALLGLAQLARADGDIDGVALAQRALGARPGDAEILEELVDALLRSGRRDDAIAALRRQLTREAPFDGRAALRLAELLPPNAETEGERRELLLRALRFGAGEPAARRLAELDPEAGEEGASNRPSERL
ncbi:MAG: tetratricopeptide repeat protein [bacterium]|nr:tetratricopeptide repeat protein [bacterium]